MKPSDSLTEEEKARIEELAKYLLPQICDFFTSEEGKKKFAQWKQKQEQKK